MSTPPGEDALRALLAEHAPGYTMVEPRFAPPLATLIAPCAAHVTLFDVANVERHDFVVKYTPGVSFDEQLSAAKRAICAPLN